MPTMSEVLLHITHHLNRFRVRHCMPRRLPQRVVDPPAGVHRSLCHLHPYKEEPVSEFKRYAEIYQRVIPLFQSRRFRTFPQGPGPIPRVRDCIQTWVSKVIHRVPVNMVSHITINRMYTTKGPCISKLVLIPSKCCRCKMCLGNTCMQLSGQVLSHVHAVEA